MDNVYTSTTINLNDLLKISNAQEVSFLNFVFDRDAESNCLYKKKKEDLIEMIRTMKHQQIKERTSIEFLFAMVKYLNEKNKTLKQSIDQMQKENRLQFDEQIDINQVQQQEYILTTSQTEEDITPNEGICNYDVPEQEINMPILNQFYEKQFDPIDDSSK
jgi:hypothetical protein